MKLVAASISLLLLAVLVCGAGPAQAGADGFCCVCTRCEFSEQCFTGLTENQSQRCASLCGEVDCDAGALQGGPCIPGPSCEVISAAPAEQHLAPVLGPLAFVLAALAAGLAGGWRLVRKTRG